MELLNVWNSHWNSLYQTKRHTPSADTFLGREVEAHRALPSSNRGITC